MQIRVYDDGASQDCLFVLGWGNRCRHETVQWLVDRLAERYRVHVAELPTHITDVKAEWVEPLEAYAAELDSFPLLSHSAGGLTAAHLDADGVTNRVYLSPWWGSTFPLPEAVLDGIRRLPLTRPLLPVGALEGDYLGEHATAERVADSPDRVSPAFLRTIEQAQTTVPPVSDDAVAFTTLTDRIVDPRAVGAHLPADRIRLYDGGHELFSSASRDQHIGTVLEAMEHGPAAL